MNTSYKLRKEDKRLGYLYIVSVYIVFLVLIPVVKMYIM